MLMYNICEEILSINGHLEAIPMQAWPLGLEEGEVLRISRHSIQGGGKVVSPTHSPPLPPGNIPGTHFR